MSADMHSAEPNDEQRHAARAIADWDRADRVHAILALIVERDAQTIEHDRRCTELLKYNNERVEEARQLRRERDDMKAERDRLGRELDVRDAELAEAEAERDSMQLERDAAIRERDQARENIATLAATLKNATANMWAAVRERDYLREAALSAGNLSGPPGEEN